MRILTLYKNALTATAILFFLGSLSVTAQTYTLNNSNSEVTIFGTSNIHDWEIVVEEQKGSLSLEEGADLTLTALEITIPVKSLKSGKSGMDKNTYKAMKADDHAEVTFKLTSPVTLSASGDNTFKVNAKGDLTISGVTKATDLVFDLTKTASGVELSGEKSLDMTTFDIEPPSALMGTIKTGKEVTLKFKTTLQ